jgi:hypothetical protein
VKSSMKIKEKRMLLNRLKSLKSELPAKSLPCSRIFKRKENHVKKRGRRMGAREYS